MVLKKFYGNTIKEAKQQAREQFGDQIVVLETVKAGEDSPGCITVMVDQKVNTLIDDNPADRKTTGNFKQVFYSRRSNKRSKNPESASQNKSPKTSSRMDDETSGSFTKASKLFNGSGESNAASSKGSDLSTATKQKRPVDANKSSILGTKPERMSRRNKPLFTGSSTATNQDSEYRENERLSREVKALHRRFDHLEKLVSDTIISANTEYISHPAFQQLLSTGMRPATVSQWFRQILDNGVDPFNEPDHFMHELGGLIREIISTSLPPAPEKHLLFVGPSGAGKSTLIMKLASHPEFMKQQHLALVSIEPREGRPSYSILKNFAEEQQIPFYSVRNNADISRLIEELNAFEHVLYDTSALSLERDSAFREYWNIRQVLASVAPLEIHFVINATLERYYFSEQYIRNHPLQPDYLAITHLDETPLWGHLIPFIRHTGSNIRYISQGPLIPDHLMRFSPSWFAENIISHS